MARVTLNNETYNAATDGSEISGNTGTEQVNVFAGVTDLEVAGNIERVDLPGDIADFTFSSFGNSLTILDGSGNVVAAVSDAGGKQVVFEDGALDVAYDGTTLTVGGETVGGTAAAITPATGEIDATTTSDSPDAGTGGGGTGGGAGTDDDLTEALFDNVVGSAGADTFLGLIDGAADTWNTGDEVDGAGGNDVFNIVIDSGSAETAPSLSSVANVERINVIVDAGGGSFTTDGTAIEVDYFDGANQIWQINNAGAASDVVGVTNGVTIGYAANTVGAVGAADATTAVSFALDDAVDAGTILVDEETANDVTDVTVNGSVDAAAGTLTIDLDTGGIGSPLAALAAEETVTLGLTSDVTVTVTSTTATTVDASGSTGDLTIDVSTSAAATEVLTGGTGDDTLTASAATTDLDGGDGDDNLTGGAASEVILGGAGDDTIVAGDVAGEEINGGAGQDDITLGTGGNAQVVITDAGESGITEATADTITNFVTTEDELDFNLVDGSADNFLFDGSAGGFVDASVNADSAFGADSDLVYVQVSDGNDSWVFVDSDGDNAADMAVELTGINTTIADADIIA